MFHWGKSYKIKTMGKNMNWYVKVGGIIGILILIIILYISLKKTPQKYYNKAIRASKKSEKYHNLGDEELAEDYAQEAAEYRQKAEGLST